MKFKCLDNSGSLVALTALTIGKEYSGRKLESSDLYTGELERLLGATFKETNFIEIYPCDDKSCMVFSDDRFEVVN